MVPYIYEDYVSTDTIAESIYKMYKMSKSERKALGQKARDYVQSEFALQTTIDLWHDSLWDLTENYRTDQKFIIEEIS
jgi:hypothetical protein